MTDRPAGSSRPSSPPQRSDPPGQRGTGAPLLVALLLFAVLAIPGCTKPGEGNIPGFLTLRLSNNPTTLDPALITDVQGGSIAAKLYNGLVRFNERLEIVPDVARSWRLSPDHRTYTFWLRKDVTFSNHRPVTAEDFRYSFERVLTPETKAPFTWVLDRIAGAPTFLAGKSKSVAGIRVLDDHTLSITLTRPFGPFLSLLAMPTAYVVPKEVVEQRGADFGQHPAGSGPYVLTAWQNGRELLLTARQDYFDGRPKLKGIRYRVIPEDLTAVLEFETGRLDALLIPASEYRRYTTDPHWRGLVYGKPGLDTYYLGLNCTRPPFNDLRVRQAMNYAIDRKRILDTVFEKRGVLAAGPVPPALWKGHPGRETGRAAYPYPYNPQKARKLLRAAGAEGATIAIYISPDPAVLDVVQVIQNYLAAVGLKATITELDWSAFKQAVNNGKADAFWLSWWADYPDPQDFLYPLFHSASFGAGGNRTRCSDPVLDRLIDRAQGTAAEGLRYRLYHEAAARVVRDAPWVFMWHRADYWVVQPWVRDFRIYPIYSIDKGMDIGLAMRSEGQSRAQRR